jgi:hypothetical protein
LGGLHSVLTTTWPIVLGLHAQEVTQGSCEVLKQDVHRS